MAAQHKERSLRQVQLAELRGTSQQMVTAYENGSRRVAITTLLLPVRTFGTSIEAFVGSLALRFPGKHVSQLLPAPANAWPAKC